MYSFKNIDDYTPGYFERVGTLRGKRWYSKNDKNGLFKPRRFEFGDKKVFVANHYGEFMGYILSQAIGAEACPVELAHLSKFYVHFFKFKYNGTPIPRDGAISYKVAPKDASIIPGQVLISKYNKENELELFKRNRNVEALNDEIPTVMSTIEAATRDFYSKKGYSPRRIKEKVDKNIADAARMICYDCSFGNNDRHDENWSMVVTQDDIRVYPLYDNERVLGLCENLNTVRRLLSSPSAIETYNTYGLFSRMRLPGAQKSTYKEVILYMLQNYPEVTRETLETVHSNVKPEFVKHQLEEMDGLPQEYVDFSSTIYNQRYAFVEKALTRDRTEQIFKPGNIDRAIILNYPRNRRIRKSPQLPESNGTVGRFDAR